MAGHRAAILFNRILSVDLPDEVIEERLKHVKKPTDHPAEKVLKQYRNGVGGAEEGALWMYRE